MPAIRRTNLSRNNTKTGASAVRVWRNVSCCWLISRGGVLTSSFVALFTVSLIDCNANPCSMTPKTSTTTRIDSSVCREHRRGYPPYKVDHQLMIGMLHSRVASEPTSALPQFHLTGRSFLYKVPLRTATGLGKRRQRDHLRVDAATVTPFRGPSCVVPVAASVCPHGVHFTNTRGVSLPTAVHAIRSSIRAIFFKLARTWPGAQAAPGCQWDEP